jgi:hypothetical protein
LSDEHKPNQINQSLNSSVNPLVFISHDGKDAELAEAFAKLLKSVSAGMIKTFRSSDKKGTDGIAFGEEWYRLLMEKLQTTSDVVCLFTERSLDRPWILFEAGVAKGKLDTPVFGVALGIPLEKVISGPFSLFQNSDDSEEALTKLVQQLSRRVQNIELVNEIVQSSILTFKEKETEILNKLKEIGQQDTTEQESDPVARLVEEMKVMPSRVAERISGGRSLNLKGSRSTPRRITEALDYVNHTNLPIGFLMAASLVRDEMPWLHELSLQTYQVIKSGNSKKM